MHFLFPLALAGLALLVLPVIIHLLVRRRATRIDFPTLRFLRATRSHQWLPRKIQQPLLLALRLLALALLIGGLAHPFWSRAQTRGRLTVLLLDSSFSLSAANRTEAVREQARSVIGRSGPADRVAIIAFDSEAKALAEPTGDSKTLLDTIAKYRPGFAGADYLRASQAVSDLVDRESTPDVEVNIISDFQASGIQNESALTEAFKALKVRIVPIAVGARVERNIYWRDLHLVASTGGPVLSATEVTQNGEAIAAAPRIWQLNQPAGDQAEINWHTEADGQIVGQLRAAGADDFADDNIRPFVIGPTRGKKALLISDQTDATTYLRAALTMSPGTTPSPIEPVISAALPESAVLDQFELVAAVLHGDPDPVFLQRLVGFAQSGGTVWLCAGSDLNSDALTRSIANDARNQLPFISLSRTDRATAMHLMVVDPTAPAVKELLYSDSIELSGVPVPIGFGVTPTADAAVVMRWSNGTPAMVQRTIGSGSVIFLGTSPERAASGLGLSPVFPQLAASIQASAGGIARPLTSFIGEGLPVNANGNLVVNIESPGGVRVNTTLGDLAKAPTAVFNVPGLYRVNDKSLAFAPPQSESATALADPALVKTVFAVDAAANGMTLNGKLPDVTRGDSWWRWLLAVAAVLLCIELLIALRGAGRAEVPAPNAE